MSENAHSWLSRIVESSAIQSMIGQLDQRDRLRIVAEGSQGSSTHLLTGALALKTNRPVLFVVPHLDDADEAMEDLALYQAANWPLSTYRFGALEVLPGESSVNLELLIERLSLVKILSKDSTPLPKQTVIVAPVQALMQTVPIPQALDDLTLQLTVGQTCRLAELLAWLTQASYQRVDAIEQAGEFAARGGIIDIYPPVGIVLGQNSSQDASQNTNSPVRIDYFGDEIDSISLIDLDTMGSGNRLKKIQLIGASIEQLQSDQRTTSLWSMLPDQTVVVLHEIMELSEQARGYYERLTNPVGIISPRAVFSSLTQRPHIEINQYSSTQRPDDTIVIGVKPLPHFNENASQAIDELVADASKPIVEIDTEDTKNTKDTQFVVMCSQAAEHRRLLALLKEHPQITPPSLTTEIGYLHRGFLWEDQGCTLQLIPHQELFHRYQVRRQAQSLMRRKDGDQTIRASDAFLDLNVGDYVVHTDHGIARFLGLCTIKPKGGKKNLPQEYLTLEFLGKAKLHVPVTQIDLVQKYIGGFQGKPPLSMLGGKRWEKQKQQVTESVKELAVELLRIQAARSSMPGIQYPLDTPWQREFEAAFPYQETEDQLAAIAAIKKNMADPQPMDRLVCGDVGFGKTEVAIRAAFKAIEYGKQVAILVPTTVLAEQHERTFKSRMADYPFRIESLSRFKSAAKQKEVLEQVALGRVDVIIGTHRLLSKDVKFADLGMVIIDEEQRFGVAHKNKLLQFRLTVDVLTLSATPIPRTLHMSMLGLRDISSLTTPPLDRRAIVTEVIPFNHQRIKQALIRELNRNGQVYFVHNRVHNINEMAADLKTLAPHAKIAIGHGQMPARQLEKIMHRFMRREIDILVCTTIIESGIDVPTANTMLINRADHFGLAELHQLRGRVGRYKHRAYCYLLLPEKMPVTDKAGKRLRAIEQYSMLGAGFKIAMRDLEIRGAGNLLGSEQSGHIATVGYEMYCQLLERETKNLKHERILEPIKTHLELPMNASLPKSYITSDKFRMETYRRFSRVTTLQQLDLVAKDLADAYGQPTRQAQAFIDLGELRVAATHFNIESVKLDGPDLIFKTPLPQKLTAIFKDAPGRVSLIDPTTIYYRPPASYLTPPSTLLAVLRKLLVRPLRENNNTTANKT